MELARAAVDAVVDASSTPSPGAEHGSPAYRVYLATLRWGYPHACRRCGARIRWNEILKISFCSTRDCVGTGWELPIFGQRRIA